MKCGAWARDEIETLFEMRAVGEKWTVIAATLGRPYDAVVTFYRDEKRRRVAAPPPVRLPPESRPDFEASILLGQRINAAIRRHANVHRVSEESATNALLGKEPDKREPGSEVIYKTASISKLTPVHQFQEAA